MKTRNAEASRLEEDYLVRVRGVLTQSGRSPGEAAEVVESVREHINEAAEGLGEAEISLSAMAAILEQLGPPAAYVESPPSAPSAPAAVPVAPPAFPAAGATTYPSGSFTFSRVFGDAITLYTQNFLPLLLASIIFDLLSMCTLLILLGPLTGGVALMTLKAIDRPDHKIDVADMFGAFRQFWPLLLLSIIVVVCVILGMVMCLVPGLLLTALWFTPFNYMVEKRMGVIDSLRASGRAALLPGNFLTIFLLGLAIWAITIVGSSIPYVGIVLLWVIMPIFWFVTTLTYVHLTRGMSRVADPSVAPVPGLGTW